MRATLHVYVSDLWITIAFAADAFAPGIDVSVSHRNGPAPLCTWRRLWSGSVQWWGVRWRRPWPLRAWAHRNRELTGQ